MKQPQVPSEQQIYNPNQTLQILEQQNHKKQCRICLNTHEENDNHFVSPCACQGTLKYVHQNCLQQWIATKLRRENDQILNQRLQCQVCRSPIQVETKNHYQCTPLAQLQKKVKKRPANFIISSIGFIISAAVVIYTCILLTQQIQNGYEKIKVYEKAIVLVSFLLTVATLIFFMFHLKKYLFTVKTEVHLVNR